MCTNSEHFITLKMIKHLRTIFPIQILSCLFLMLMIKLQLFAGFTSVVFHVNTGQSLPRYAKYHPKPNDMHDLQHTEENVQEPEGRKCHQMVVGLKQGTVQNSEKISVRQKGNKKYKRWIQTIRSKKTFSFSFCETYWF